MGRTVEIFRRLESHRSAVCCLRTDEIFRWAKLWLWSPIPCLRCCVAVAGVPMPSASTSGASNAMRNELISLAVRWSLLSECRISLFATWSNTWIQIISPSSKQRKRYWPLMPADSFVIRSVTLITLVVSLLLLNYLKFTDWAFLSDIILGKGVASGVGIAACIDWSVRLWATNCIAARVSSRSRIVDCTAHDRWKGFGRCEFDRKNNFLV